MKMDSRFRGNDGGEGGNLSGKNQTAAGGGIPQKTAEFAAKNPPQFPPKTRKKTPVIPAENKKNPPSFPRKRESIMGD